MSFRGTTIIAVRKDGKVCIAGDGQVTAGDTIMKGNAHKVRKIYQDKIIVGFAGGTSDAITLRELLEKKLAEVNGDLTRASVNLAKEWRMDRALHKLEAMILATDGKKIFLITGTGASLSRNTMPLPSEAAETTPCRPPERIWTAQRTSVQRRSP